MSIETAWFVPAPAIETVWIGPAGEAEAREAQVRERDPIPLIIGPRAPGLPGEDGASAYEIAVANGFVGNEAAWLASLVGGAGDDGASAYAVAFANGFVGSEAAWLASLVGAAGDDGASAYAVAVANGFVGSEAAWLASLVGAVGDDGASAYAVAVANGFVGSEAAWLASLAGATGPAGPQGLHAVLPIPSGRFAQLGITNAFNSTNTAGGGNQWYWPFLPARNLTIDALAAEVTTAVAGAKFFLAIFAADAVNSRPTGAAIAITPELSAATTGSKLGALVGGNRNLVAGTLYFIAAYCSSGAPTFRVVGAGGAMQLPSLETAANSAIYCYNGTAAVITTPVPGSLFEGAQNPVHVRLRVA